MEMITSWAIVTIKR